MDFTGVKNCRHFMDVPPFLILKTRQGKKQNCFLFFIIPVTPSQEQIISGTGQSHGGSNESPYHTPGFFSVRPGKQPA